MKKYGRFLLIPILVLAVFSTACSTAWVSTLDSILSAAAPALIDILQIVAVANGQPANGTLAAKISSDATVIKTLAADFAKDGSTNACTTLQNAIATYQVDQNLVLGVAQVSNSATQTKIALLSDLVAGAVTAVLAVIPQCQAPASLAKSVKAGPPLKLRTFVADYNAVLITKTGNLAVDAVTPKLQIHQHSKAVRVLTFGYLK
jgi:hypothetical protein